MIHRHSLVWPDARPFSARDGRPIRILAVSDEVDPALRHPANREAVGPIDAILGCGDLEPSELAFLADAFYAPLAFVRGNHDVGIGWRSARRTSRRRCGAAEPDASQGCRSSGSAGRSVRADRHRATTGPPGARSSHSRRAGRSSVRGWARPSRRS